MEQSVIGLMNQGIIPIGLGGDHSVTLASLRAAEMGDYMLKGLQAAASSYTDKVLEIRGKGLLIGIEFQSDEIGYEVSKGLFDHGVLVAGTLINAKTIRIEPPLTITYEEADHVMAAFKKVLGQVKV